MGSKRLSSDSRNRLSRNLRYYSTSRNL